MPPETHRGRQPPEGASTAACRCKHHRHSNDEWKWATITCDDGELETVAWQDCAKANARAYINRYLRTGGQGATGQEAPPPQAQAQQAEQPQQQDEADDDDDDAPGPSSTRAPAAAEAAQQPPVSQGVPAQHMSSGGTVGSGEAGFAQQSTAEPPPPVEAKAKWVPWEEARFYRQEETDGVLRTRPLQPLPTVWSSTRPRPENYHQAGRTAYTGGDQSYGAMPSVGSQTSARPEDFYPMGETGDMGDMGEMGETDESATRQSLGVLPTVWGPTQCTQF